MSITKEAIQEIAGLATKGVSYQLGEEGAKLLITPGKDGTTVVQSLKPFIDEFRTAPERRKGTAKALTLQSFVDLANRHKDDDSAIFATLDAAQPKFTAVIDYNTIKHEARFDTHRVEYAFPMSPEWQAWRGKDGAVMSQLDFAAFIEDRLSELASPLDAEKAQMEGLFGTKFGTPAEIMQLSRGLQINAESVVKEIRRLQSGEAQISYIEVHKDGAGQMLVVPGLFVVSVPLFAGAEPTRMIARLRYRKSDSIKWFFNFWRVAETVRAALLNDLDKVAKEMELPVFEGAPEV